MKYIKLFEAEDPIPVPDPVPFPPRGFNPEIDIKALEYDNHSNSVFGVYRILEKNDKITKLENIQELQTYSGMRPFSHPGKGDVIAYFDNMYAGYRIKRVVDLPTRIIRIDKNISDDYYLIYIPYWLFKKNYIGLKIKKLDKTKFRLRDRTDYIDMLDSYI